MRENTVRKEAPLTLMHMLAKAGVRDDLAFARGIEINPDLTPKPHQVTALNQALTQPNDRFGLYDETGCMKTLPVQAYCLYHAGMGNKVVVVMPPILLEQFSESLSETFVGYEKFFSTHILTEGPKKRDQLFALWDKEGWPDIMLMTYQTFAKRPRPGRKKDPETKQWVKTEPRRMDFISVVLQARGYNVLVCDEAHALKNPGSDNFKTVQLFVGKEGDTALVLMTGTPAHNTLLDTFALIKLITPDRYASKRSFERLHSVYQDGENGWSRLVGFINKDTMSRNLYAQARRVTKDQVLDLKEPQVIQVPVHLDPAHYRLYKKLIRERFLELGDGEMINAITQQALREKCLQIVTTPDLFTDDRLKNNILEATDELLDSIGLESEKVAIFANHQNTIRLLMDHYSEYNPVAVYGGTGGGAANRRNIEIFKTDDRCRLTIMHPRSGGVGLNLQDVCRYMIFVEPLSVPGEFKQACDRIHRGEIKHVVTFYMIKAMKTLGVKMVRDMLSKERDIMMVTKDKKSVMADLMGE